MHEKSSPSPNCRKANPGFAKSLLELICPDAQVEVLYTKEQTYLVPVRWSEI